MPVALIATVPLVYDGRSLRRGARFVARSADDARVLTLLGKAKAVPIPVEESDSETVTDEEPRPRRTYRRRTITTDETSA